MKLPVESDQPQEWNGDQSTLDVFFSADTEHYHFNHGNLDVKTPYGWKRCPKGDILVKEDGVPNGRYLKNGDAGDAEVETRYYFCTKKQFHDTYIVPMAKRGIKLTPLVWER